MDFFFLLQINSKRNRIVIHPRAPFEIGLLQAAPYAIHQQLQFSVLLPKIGLAVALFHSTGRTNVLPICSPLAKVAAFTVLDVVTVKAPNKVQIANPVPYRQWCNESVHPDEHIPT